MINFFLTIKIIIHITNDKHFIMDFSAKSDKCSVSSLKFRLVHYLTFLNLSRHPDEFIIVVGAVKLSIITAGSIFGYAGCLRRRYAAKTEITRNFPPIYSNS